MRGNPHQKMKVIADDRELIDPDAESP